MAANSGSPPTHTIKPINPPPPSDQPTSAMLKAEIDSGRTDDKVGVFDPELSTLGTDNKATGQPPSPFRFTLARFHEALGQSIRGGRQPWMPIRCDLLGYACCAPRFAETPF